MAAMLANAQASSGHDVCVVYSRRPETPENIDKLFISKVRIGSVDMTSIRGRLFSFYRVRKLFKQNGLNVVVLHSSFAGFIGRVASLFIGGEVRFFYIPHCISLMRRDVGVVKRVLFLVLEWLAAIKPCTYLACSESEAKVIQAAIPFRSCLLVENAIEQPRLSIPPQPRNRTVVTVGGIRPQKGPEEFAALARLVSERIAGVEFLWIGDGDATLRQYLIDAGVTVSGWLDRSDVLNTLSSASVYVSTARWEGMPVSVIEAMYVRLPVVASVCAGNVDVITDGKNGWLFRETSQGADRVVDLLASPLVALWASEKAYADACARFSPERYCRAMSEILQLTEK